MDGWMDGLMQQQQQRRRRQRQRQRQQEEEEEKKEQEEEEDMVVSENWVCNFQEKNDEYPQMKYSMGDPLSFLAIFPLVGAIPSNKQNEGNPPRLVSMDWFCW
jgi:hypothetical protein